jgi:hypothetical protein
MSIRRLALHAQRVSRVFAHPATWAKLIRERGRRRPRLRLHPSCLPARTGQNATRTRHSRRDGSGSGSWPVLCFPKFGPPRRAPRRSPVSRAGSTTAAAALGPFLVSSPARKSRPSTTWRPRWSTATCPFARLPDEIYFRRDGRAGAVGRGGARGVTPRRSKPLAAPCRIQAPASQFSAKPAEVYAFHATRYRDASSSRPLMTWFASSP